MKIKELKNGQRVRIVLEGTVTSGAGNSDPFIAFDGDKLRNTFYVGKDRTEEVEILPDPIKTGDRVSISGFGATGVVTLIDSDGWHIIKFDKMNTIPYGTFKGDRLTKIEKDCDC